MTTTDPNAPPDELGDPNSLPDPVSGAVVPSETNLANAGFVDVDEYHQEVANRSHVRQTLFLKWDTSNGLFMVGQDQIAGYPGNESLLCTVQLAMFSFQYWLPNMGGVGCENQNPGSSPFGNWRLPEGKTQQKACATCEKNPRNGAKGDTCKDALNLALDLRQRQREAREVLVVELQDRRRLQQLPGQAAEHRRAPLQLHARDHQG